MINLNNQYTLCQHYLKIVYHNLLPPPAKLLASNVNETYGEILHTGVDKLLSSIQLTDQDVFADLGSGLGKLLIQVFLTSPIKEAIGIEIIPALHQQALVAANRIQQELPEFFLDERKLHFIQGSFLDFSFETATIALLGSPCFSLELLDALGEKFNKSSTLHTVFSLRPINTLQRLRFKKTIRIECSWDTALCYLYQ